jgi:plastocyanin
MGRPRPLVLALVLVAFVLGLAAPARASTLVRAFGTACSNTNHFSPSAASVGRGATVVWKSACSKHSVTAYGGNWSKSTTIRKGQTTSRKFTSAGTFLFRCKFHSTLASGTCVGMCGKVTVG